ncbi:hypothetical protein [Dechloromonas denitrificans]|uniref:hypothetical protein n=1 Tax=Dechloromonas denitrificans TaxID=281362 RepID=UPI001CF84227|nr:hypothetical protein [Dechloromonas denitrificans]UCV01746.1 hypothetical protein KI611_11490 [Dechloromonas denitrificans]
MKTRNRRSPRPKPKRRCCENGFALYESLKASLTATATTSAEYEAACRQAAKLAGV